MLIAGSWFLPQHVLDALSGALDNWVPPEEQVQAFITRRSRSGGGEDLFLRDEGTARIPIVGMMTKEPSFFFDLFGGGSAVYGDVIEAIHTADGDPDIDRIVLEIDSPGGNVEGFFDLARAVRLTKTRIEAEVTDTALSAAYGIASQTDQITLNNPMGSVGSVGVVTRRFIDESVVRITSTAAPKKAPDAATPEGVAVIQEELDGIHAEFVELIAQGRSAALGRTITAEQVNDTFGSGAVVLGRNALAVDMIDAIASVSTEPTTGAPSPSSTTGVKAMAEPITLESFRAENRSLYNSITEDARAEGVTVGVAQERDRVAAHAVAGEQCGNHKLALKLIGDGSEFSSQVVQAQYLMAGRSAAEDADARADDDAAGGTDDAAAVAARAEADRLAAATGNGDLPDALVESVFSSISGPSASPAASNS